MTFQEYKALVHEPKLGKMAGDRVYRIERNISAAISYTLHIYTPSIWPNAITSLSLVILFGVFIFAMKPFSAYAAIGFIALLYSITILDKIDGELARASGRFTQMGVYLDRTVHFLYPFVLYFVVGRFFYEHTGEEMAFYLTLLLGALSQGLELFGEARLRVRETVAKDPARFKDISVLPEKKEEGRPPLPLRMVDYTTSMLYLWTLVYYVTVFAISLSDPFLAHLLYLGHIAIALTLVGYRVLYSYPRHKLFYTKDF